MNQKLIGIIVMIVALLLTVTVFMIKDKEDRIIESVIEQEGSCFLEDGTCLHQDRNIVFYIFGWIISAALFMLGVYLVAFDKTQKLLAENQLKVSKALEEASKSEKTKDEFKAYLAGFSEDEQKILKAIKEQEGIKQSTLRFRTGLSKTTLSLILKSLEERDIVKRKPSGKTNEVFLRKKF